MTLHSDKPTVLTFRELYTWVIWQFPVPKDSCFCGAVRPQTAEHDWYAALINPYTEQVHLFAHIEQTFSSPEAALDYFKNSHA